CSSSSGPLTYAPRPGSSDPLFPGSREGGSDAPETGGPLPVRRGPVRSPRRRTKVGAGPGGPAGSAPQPLGQGGAATQRLGPGIGRTRELRRHRPPEPREEQGGAVVRGRVGSGRHGLL